MKGALIGYGTIAGGHHQAYLKMDSLHITAVVDHCEQRRAATLQLDPAIAIYSSLTECCFQIAG